MDVERNVNIFLEGQGKNQGRQATERYASYDYCFNYFQDFRDQDRIHALGATENLQLSCLHLGFYLASWGMLRGSSFLLEKSAKFLAPVIYEIAGIDRRIWEIDADNYTPANIELLLSCRKRIGAALGDENQPSKILITKIMMGVFGNVPAFDTYFCSAFNVGTFSPKSLRKVATFYTANAQAVDQYAEQIHTFDFLTGLPTARTYSKAKIINMVAFVQGLYIAPAQPFADKLHDGRGIGLDISVKLEPRGSFVLFVRA